MDGSRFTLQARLEGPFPSKKELEHEAAEWRRLGYKVRLGKDKHGFWLIRQPRKGLARNPEPPLEQRGKELYALSVNALKVQVKQIYRVVDVRGASKDVLASMILEAEGYYRKRKAPAPNPGRPVPSGAMEGRAVRALRRTWQAIGHDVFAAPGSRQIFRGKDVGYMAADHVQAHGGDSEAARWFLSLPSAGAQKVLDRAFPRSQRFCPNPRAGRNPKREWHEQRRALLVTQATTKRAEMDAEMALGAASSPERFRDLERQHHMLGTRADEERFALATYQHNPNPRACRNLSPGAHREHYEQDMLLAGYAARQGKARSALYYGGRAKGHRFSAGDEGPTPHNPTAKELGDNPGRPFAWKRLGKMGDFVVRLRFNDERRGEAFFDRTFAAFQPLGPGVVGIGAEVRGGSYDFDGLPATLAELQNALRPGTQLTLAPSWVSPRGRRDLYWLRVTVSSAERQKNVVVVRYSQASGAAPNPAEDYLHVFRHGGRWFVQFSSSSACPGRPGAVAAEYPDRRTAEVRASRMVTLYKQRVFGGKVKVLVHGGPGVNPGGSRKGDPEGWRRASHSYNQKSQAEAYAEALRKEGFETNLVGPPHASTWYVFFRKPKSPAPNPGTSIDQVVRDPEYQMARRLFIRLHGHEPESVRRIILPIGGTKRITGRAFFVDMGEAPSESYEPDNPKSRKHGKLWVHAYERHNGRRPHKLVSADGKLILTAPGAHRVRAGADGEAWIHG